MMAVRVGLRRNGIPRYGRSIRFPMFSPTANRWNRQNQLHRRNAVPQTIVRFFRNPTKVQPALASSA